MKVPTMSRDISLSVEEVAARIAAIGADRERVWWKTALSIGPDYVAGSLRTNNRFEVWFGPPSPRILAALAYGPRSSEATVRGYLEPGPSGCHLFGVVRSRAGGRYQHQRMREIVVGAIDIAMGGAISRREDSW